MVDVISSTSSEIKTNNMKDFKNYIETNEEELNKYSNDIKYTYKLDLQIYSSDTKNIVKLNPNNVMNIMGMGNSNNMTNPMMGSTNVFSELTDNRRLLETQYDIVEGRLPENYNEVVLIIDENNEITDYTLYSIGLKDQKKLIEIMQTIMSGKKVEKEEQVILEYEDILETEFKLVLNTDIYKKENNKWIDYSNDESFMKNIIKKSPTLKIVGIIKPDSNSSIETAGGIGYTSKLTNYVINKINKSEIVNEQKSNESINVFTNTKFNIGENIVTNYLKMGVVDIDNPNTINIYPKDFNSKDNIEEFIKKYNENKKNEDKIEYTDYVGILMSSITTIIDIISYVLIAFVSISLIVSSIMIGIITYISVLERTKEIGILRAIGASKKDIRRVFNAETFIIGLISGLLGVIVTVLLNIPINKLIFNLSGINVNVNLPYIAAIILVVISLTLTIISGLIPSNYAAKKDPVEALRTE